MSGPGKVRSYIVQFVHQYMDSPGKGWCVPVCGVVTVDLWLLSVDQITDFILNSLERCPHEFLNSRHPSLTC